MFISIDSIISKYNASIRGIIHVGAHLLEERETYIANNIKNIVWIEGNDELVTQCRTILNNQNSSDILLNYLVYDVDGIEIDFNITNNTQSSSILPFGKHKQYYSYIDFVKTLRKKTYTLETIINENSIDISKYNMLNLDLQGVELRALKGLKNYINNIDFIYTEVNNDNIYEGNDMICDIDNFLQKYNFVRVETFMLSEQWGDAFYIKQ
jgi:FkbM family methyltransferase